MKIVIEHRKTKRKINGAFSICCGKDELKELKAVIDNNIENNFAFGWINFDEFIMQKDSDFDLIKRQKSNTNTEPISWD